ncbi:AIPR protein [Stackebrandtia endophytica]|uniref:AIPR protein n=1 Tax=Stackebrandtia endophytica TaxID=1496996 RepID=A0A543B3H9_9ACTN|nr:AIPR family protein [Stackebrandtia endophytica]TQL79352.1 AIPR protein [Stackebrandtia endophytica]
MDPVIHQLMTEYCAEQGLDSWSDPDKFEVFTAHCVLSEHTYDRFRAADFRIGGSADGGIDGYAVVVNRRLFREPESLAHFIRDATEISPTIVVFQAKSSANMDRKFISDLRIRVENILRTDAALPNAADVEPLRECLRLLRKNMNRLSSRGVDLMVAYASTSPQANSDMLHEAQQAGRHLAGIGIVKTARFVCQGRDELDQLYQRTRWSSEVVLTFNDQYSMPVDSTAGVKQAWHGVVAAGDLIDALSTDGRLRPELFSENIREYQTDATVNDDIRGTLRDDVRRRRFAVLNNGITIVARSLGASTGRDLVMRDFQVVNGCQTCHVLAEEADRLDGVTVKVQILECDDDDVVSEIVTSTNRQTQIPKVYFTNRKSLVKRLEVYYRHQQARGRPLHFGRKPGKGANDLRSGVVGLNPQLRAYVAMFGPLAPSSGHRDLDDQFDTIFKHAAEEEFYTAAAALYRWEWLVDSRRVAKKFRPLGYQAIAVVGLWNGVRPLGGRAKEKAKRLAGIQELIWSDGQWERRGYDIQALLDDALVATDFADPRSAGAATTFGETVVNLARRQARQPKRAGFA